MKISTATHLRYIPEWNGNRDLPDDEQVKVEIKYPTLSERDYYNSFAAKENVFLKSYVAKFVTKIEGLTENRDGADVAILTGEDLIKSTAPALWPLALELCAEIVSQSRMDESIKKK